MKNIDNTQMTESKNYPSIGIPMNCRDYVPEGAVRVCRELMVKLYEKGLYHFSTLDTSTKGCSVNIFLGLFHYNPNVFSTDINGKVDIEAFVDDVASRYSTIVTENKSTGKKESWWFHTYDNSGNTPAFYLPKNDDNTYTQDSFLSPEEIEGDVDLDSDQDFEFDEDELEATCASIHYWVLKKEVVMVYQHGHISIAYSDGNFPRDIFDIIRKHSVPFYEVQKRKLYLVALSHMSGLYLQYLEQKKGHSNDVSYYNDDFKPIDEKIQRFIKNDETGLVILHGEQGTGKTSYIRSLMNQTKRKVVYMPANLMSEITSPTFLPFAVNSLKNSLLIIEDCEQLLRSRESTPYVNGGLIGLLNMADGLLGDNINAKIICTFNTNKENIDEALLRKGRLKARYEFKKLLPEKAKELNSKFKLGIPDTDLSNGMTLAEMFNYTPEDHSIAKPQHNRIGFN